MHHPVSADRRITVLIRRLRAQVQEERYEDDEAVLTIFADERLMAELAANPKVVLSIAAK